MSCPEQFGMTQEETCALLAVANELAEIAGNSSSSAARSYAVHAVRLLMTGIVLEGQRPREPKEHESSRVKEGKGP